MSNSSKYKRYSNKPAKSKQGAASKKKEPFSLRIHPRVRSVLKQIGVPHPREFVPDPFQIEALETLQEADVLVTAPTGAGKTYIAVQAIAERYGTGGQCWYASPLKALSNAKYHEFRQMFGDSSVGILTGDRKENPRAPIIVGTTEILRNQLYDAMHLGEDLDIDLVILDEAHYLGDEDRGVVWEEVLIYLPSRVQILLLSATIQNAEEICDWLEWLRGRSCRWVSAKERPVPLFPLFLFPSGELTPLRTRRGLFPKIQKVDPRGFSRGAFPDIPKILQVLEGANLLPAIFFLKSRADCEKAISLCPPSSGAKNDAFHSRLQELLEEYPFLRQHRHLSILKRSRVGAHHGGQLPHWKLFLEKLMQEGLLKAIFSTSTVAAGVNFPARTVVIFQSDRFNGREFVDLTATDLLQMTGRAGRRGMDEIGFVLVIPGPYQNPELIHGLLRSPPDPINSQIQINFSMSLNLLLSHAPEEIRRLFAYCFATYQNLKREKKSNERYQSVFREMEQWAPEMACGSPERLAEVRTRYLDLQNRIRKSRKELKKRASYEAVRQSLVPGRLFLDRKETPHMVVDPMPDEPKMVRAVRLNLPVRMRKGQVRAVRVPFGRIAELGELAEDFPPLEDKRRWEEWIEEVANEPFRTLSLESDPQASSSLGKSAGSLARLMEEKAALPCEECPLFGPCLKTTRHPFSNLAQQYMDHRTRLQSVQERLWQAFLKHYRFLQREGYVDEEGRLTSDGMWASKLRLDQPLLISEAIRSGTLPSDAPALLAGLIALFVMDRERPGDERTSAVLIWKYPDLAGAYFGMSNELQPLQDRLKSWGFAVPVLPFWTMVTVYQWALGDSWEALVELSGMDDGDLAMVVLRTADHLRQIEALHETHPELAACARHGIGLILREPVLVV